MNRYTSARSANAMVDSKCAINIHALTRSDADRLMNEEDSLSLGRTDAMRPQYVGAFTIGDQLRWSAAEPLRRILRILQA